MTDRRLFIKKAGLSILPAVMVPQLYPGYSPLNNITRNPPRTGILPVNFVSDGELGSPAEYISKLAEIASESPIKPDVYGSGGVVEALQKKFESITGKEKAIYMPTGTMANQLAIAALAGNNTKVFVQETSHVYRDEADAAQSVHNKRLIPLAKGAAAFTLSELREAIDYHNNGEVFKSGIGVVSIENPVRRANGVQMPMGEIKAIANWCRANNIKLHLDGARLFLASAYSGIPIRDYCSQFDTVYISLYKYFGASGGAILCGNADLIKSMEHQIKIFGGTMYQAWPQAAMALHVLNGFEERFHQAVKKGDQLFAELNKLADIKITPWQNGSNVFQMKFAKEINTGKFSEMMKAKFGIIISGHLNEGIGRLAVNESILRMENTEFVRAFAESLKASK